MTQRGVEILIRKLLTDEELRQAFQRDPQATLLRLQGQGLELSSLELRSPRLHEPSGRQQFR